MTESNNQRPAQMPARPSGPEGVRRPAPGTRQTAPIQGGARQAPGAQGRAPIRQGVPQQGGARPMQRQMAHPQQTRPMNPAGAQMRPQSGMPHQPQRQQMPQQRPTYSQQQMMGTPQQSPVQQTAIPHNNPMKNVTPKTLGIAAVLLLFIGIILGAMMFSGSSTPQPTGLQGVVRNTDIRAKLPRCGRTDKGQACILYIMNSTRYDQIAESFFEEALRLTEVPIYSISMANPKYAKRRIPPGHFAEIHIPKVR